MRHRGALALFLCAACGCGEAPSPPAAPGRGANVLLVTVDTLRADRLGCMGWERASTPRLDALAAEGFLFERALCATPVTLPSHTSLLTGRHPFEHGVRDNGLFRAGPELLTLGEILQTHGYTTAAFVSAGVLARRYGLDQGFARYDDAFGADAGGPRAERPADETVDAALDWLAAPATDAPWFAWVHLFDPHAPYAPPPDVSAGDGSLSDRYDGEIAFVDRQLGRLLDALPADPAGATLVIVTSDHGESLGEHDELTHGLFVYDSVMQVPLLLHLPALGGGRRLSGQVAAVDLFPTVLDLLGIGSVENSGRSLLPRLLDPGADVAHEAYLETLLPHTFLGLAPLAALATADDKYIEAPRPELYAWPLDPGEQDDLVHARPERARDLARRLRQLRGGRDLLDGVRMARPDGEQRRTLEALGYVFGAGGAETAGADPKDVAPAFTRLNAEAAALTARGRHAEAVSVLEELLTLCPRYTWALTELGKAQRALGQLDQAVDVLEAALALRVDDPAAGLELGRVRRLQGRIDAALAAYDGVLLGEPGHVTALLEAAQVAFEHERWERAADYAERALATGSVPASQAAQVRATWDYVRARRDER